MKIVKFVFATEVNYGSETEPDIKQLLTNASYPYSEENLAKVKTEAYNGEYEIVDDGQPEPEPTELEKLRADLDFLSVMTGVSL